MTATAYRDDQHLIQMAVNLLAVPNQMRFFHNGQEALNYLRTTQENPLLIISDVNMPIMNGLELRAFINDDEYLKRKAIPFIFLTTAVNWQVIQVAYDGTVQGFYQKASNFEGLKAQMQLMISYWKSCLHPNSELN